MHRKLGLENDAELVRLILESKVVQQNEGLRLVDKLVSHDRILDSSATVLACNGRCPRAIGTRPQLIRGLPSDPLPIVTAASAAALIAGSLVLLGWMHDVQFLKFVFHGLASMKVNTAVAFELVGMSMGLLTFGPRYEWQRWLAKAAAIGAILIGGFTLVEYFCDCDFGIDEWFIRDQLTNQQCFPGRPSPATALSFCLLGLALVLLPSKRVWRSQERRVSCSRCFRCRLGTPWLSVWHRVALQNQFLCIDGGSYRGHVRDCEYWNALCAS